ncbi:hypothetical protein M438DRAFT_408724 [Aureobasidium pullulans EXF-150]|uniref:Uncharacterized protein n=1 Tax=Aureobasidium pullulans EXF-150 TaxID=1043002 RepID=A0A074X4A1_AURPU|nr:uncharacterized protein M438DRAFT_408724 [Aureobasidium pullulans EXF-150]KEQ80340.1 hypothetical protein M438DRAFT_408724 [Aureobasidium pullulans EXF-150]
MPRARPFAGVIGGLTGQKRPVPLDNTETTQIPKLQKIDTSEIEKRVKDLKAEAKAELKVLDYSKLRIALHSVNNLKKQGWIVNGDEARDPYLKEMRFGSRRLKWWLNTNDISMTKTIRADPYFADDAIFEDMFPKEISRVLLFLAVCQSVNEFVNHIPDMGDEMMQAERYFEEHKSVKFPDV